MSEEKETPACQSGRGETPQWSHIDVSRASVSPKEADGNYQSELSVIAAVFKKPEFVGILRDYLPDSDPFDEPEVARAWLHILRVDNDRKLVTHHAVEEVALRDEPACATTLRVFNEAAEMAATWRDPVAKGKRSAKAMNKRFKAREKENSAVLADAVMREPMITRLCDVQAESVSWLWPSRFALGKLALLVGDPAVGKSFLTCELAALVSTGGAWPDGSGNAPCGGVVILNAEDGLADTIKPRLLAAGADDSKIVTLDGVRNRDDKGREVEAGFCLADLEMLEQAIQAVPNCKLVVIDPISAYMGATDSHVNSDVRGLLKPLGDVAAKYRVAVLLVSHLNKSAAQAMYRTTGSLAFVAAARSAWICVPSPDDPAKRMMLSLKNNLAPDVGGLAYTISEGRVQWQGAVSVSVNDAMAQTRDGDEDGGALGDAKAFLLDALAAGPVDANEVLRLADESGVARRTLTRAKAALKIKAAKAKGSAGPWKWSLPAIMPKAASPEIKAPLAALPEFSKARDDWEPTKIDPSEFKPV